MSGLIAGDIKDLLSIRIKPRHDSIPDQYSRIFMVKLMLVCVIVMGLNYTDKINCIIPESLDIGDPDNDNDNSYAFVASTCWIQGMYVYKVLKDRVDEVAYFGMPKNIDYDGIINGTNDLCVLNPKMYEYQHNKNCIPMEKTFYQQYQWFTFFLAALTLLYYLPYIAFCKVNNDLIVLKLCMKTEKQRVEKLMQHFFNTSRRRSTSQIILRPILNILIKIMYICANLISFMSLDNVLNGEFMKYGKKWIEWSKLDNTMMYDYMGMRDFPKPGNKLLPPFGYCEFFESASDIKQSKANKFKLVCEISQHVLYQYCLLLLWFCIIFGIIVSVLGLLNLLWANIWMLLCCKCGKKRKGPYSKLNFREIEYMEYIKKKDNVIYGELLSMFNESNGFKEKYPLKAELPFNN